MKKSDAPSYKSDADRVVLGSVNPPEGDSWQFSYTTANRLYEMSRVTTPTGGNINYSFGLSPLNWGIGYYKGYRTMVQRTAAGRDIPAGTWTFSYFQAPNHEYTLVSDPCGRSIKYRHYGFDSGLPNGQAWKIGLPISREIVGQERVDYTWMPSQAISYDNYSMGSTVASDTEIYVPYPASETITREGQTYTTIYSNYDAYGNPGSIVETGDKSRTRTLTYWYNTALNIVKGKPATETVFGNLPGTFTTNYYYDSSNGNLLRVDKYGANTYYQYASNGNLTSVKDPNGNFTYYQWSNGAVSRISNTVYAVNRTINSMGLTTSETNGRGHTTSFTYDGNLRLRGITPPVGNPTIITYPTDSSYKRETRGGYTRTTYYDGIGRLSGTEDSRGVVTDVAYKACGLKDYTTSNIGDTISFDNFGRVRDVVHQDNTALHYTYAGSTATVKDEALNTTVLTSNAFGKPDEKMLMAVKDATNATTSYTRNILGSLTGITQGATTRSFVYDSRSYLQSETHPESGTTTYTRYPMGQLMTKTDAAGTVSYAYDGLNRLTTVTYGSNQIGFDYDNADNRTAMTSPGASAAFTYDAANLMTGQTTTVAGRTYTTAYTYDNNDNLIQQTNPTGLGVSFGYNANNQVTSASGFSGGISAVQYNAAGLPTSFTYSNTVPSLIAYNNRNLTTRTTAGAALDLGYGYDSRGNTTAIADYLDSTRNQSFGYDSLNRLTAANGSWGTGAFAYNPNGDRQTKTMAGIATSYTYASNRLASAAGGEAASYTYGGNGRLTGLTQNGSTNTLDYDTLNNLLAYKQGATTIASYGYDGDGRRVTKTAGGTTTVYHYDKAGRVISETAQDGAIKADYVFLNDRMAAKVTPLENYQCPAGLAYNAAADRCEATPACPAGGSYSSATDRCESPVITDYQCSVTGLIFGNLAACTSACSQTAACTQTPATSASGTAPVYYDGSWSYTNATGSGNKITFVSYQCSSDLCLPWSTAPITLSGATASGSAYIKGSVKSPATNVTVSGSSITFSGGDSSGTITLSGATVTGSGIINGGPGFANVTIGGSGNKINFSGGLSSGSLTLTSTAPPYTCPLGSYSCTGTPFPAQSRSPAQRSIHARPGTPSAPLPAAWPQPVPQAAASTRQQTGASTFPLSVLRDMPSAQPPAAARHRPSAPRAAPTTPATTGANQRSRPGTSARRPVCSSTSRAPAQAPAPRPLAATSSSAPRPAAQAPITTAASPTSPSLPQAAPLPSSRTSATASPAASTSAAAASP